MKKVSILLSLIVFCVAQNNTSTKTNNPTDVDTTTKETKIIEDVKIDILQSSIADLLSGRDKSYFDPILLLSDAFWTEYSHGISEDYDKIKTERFDHMSSWSDDNFINSEVDTSLVFYPFSGPDFLHVYFLYPNANEYIFLAREKIGSIPDFKGIGEAATMDYLKNTTYFLRDVTFKSFFFTNNMKADIEQDFIVPGVISSLYWMLSRTNHQIVKVERVSIDENGALIPKQDSDQLDGVRFHFIKKGDKRIKKLTYFSCDISDGGFTTKNPQLLSYLQSIRSYNTYVKAASYLMHYSFFSKIRNVIIENSLTIFQDDTGIPYKYVNNENWSVRHFGSYVKPPSNFAEDYDILYQQDMVNLYKNNESEKLPFSLGYHFPTNRQNQMLLTRNK